MIHCFIIDDEMPAIKIIKRYIDRLPDLQFVGAETNPVKGIEIIKREKPDIVFLDLEMTEMNGIEVVKQIGEEIKVILCSAYSESAVAGYDLKAMAYLTKPIEFHRFIEALKPVLDSNRLSND
jgi:two-component SAPR family response regulator